MVHLEQIIDFCMKFPGATQDFPFDQDTMVFRVQGKIFALVNTRWWYEGKQWVNVKCQPEQALVLREKYDSIIPGYHMSKKHWNTLVVHEEELSLDQICDYITHSYDLVS